MSYTILYRSMYVKLSDGKYIPMVEMGDNNVYDVTGPGKQRRSRSWQQLIVGKQYDKLAHTKEEIMGYIESIIQDEIDSHVGKPSNWDGTGDPYTKKDVEQHFGYFSGWCVAGRSTGTTSAQQVRNFFKRGFEQVVSFEQDTDLVLRLHWGYGEDYGHQEVSSEKDLLEAWERLHESHHCIWVDYYYAGDYLWRLHHNQAPKREKKQTVLTAQTLSRVMSYSDYEKIAKEGDRVLVMATDLTRTSIWSRKKVYTVVRTNDPDGTILRKHGGRNSVYFPRDSWSYGSLMAAVLTDEEYKLLAA